MERLAVFDELKQIFEDVFDHEGDLADTTTSDDVGEWDSVGHIRLILACEEAFSVRFLPKEVVDLKNLGALVDLIQAKQG